MDLDLARDAAEGRVEALELRVVAQVEPAGEHEPQVRIRVVDVRQTRDDGEQIRRAPTDDILDRVEHDDDGTAHRVAQRVGEVIGHLAAETLLAGDVEDLARVLRAPLDREVTRDRRVLVVLLDEARERPARDLGVQLLGEANEHEPRRLGEHRRVREVEVDARVGDAIRHALPGREPLQEDRLPHPALSGEVDDPLLLRRVDRRRAASC